MRYTVAAVQFEPRFGDKAYNLTELTDLTTQAARAGARLVVLPEMATTGYCFRSRVEIAPLVEPVPTGPTVVAFAALARQLGIHIVIGLPEVAPATGAFYNSAVLIGPTGYIGTYRKTHSFIDDTRWARDGDLGIPVFETELGRIALLICMDGAYFEPARLAALDGADLIAFPTNWLGNQSAWRARAMENGLYMLCANRWGEERGTKFCGNSAVIDPTGAVANLLSDGDGLAMADVDLDVARAARTVALAARQPERYQELLINSYLWHWKDAQRLPNGRPVVVAVGEATTGEAMANEMRWADKRARDRGWQGLDLAVFPACPAYVDSLIPGKVARDLNAHVVWGAPGQDGAATVYLVGPDGASAAYSAGRRELVTDDPLQGVPVDGGYALFDLPWGRLGLLTQTELLLPEPARILAKRGADIIAVPTRWENDHSRLLWRPRSIENETVLALANAVGGSQLLQPIRPFVTGADVPGEMVLAQVDTAKEAMRSKEYLRMLQPRWYEPLVRPAR